MSTETPTPEEAEAQRLDRISLLRQELRRLRTQDPANATEGDAYKAFAKELAQLEK